MSIKLDIGCGNNLKEGYLGVDCRKLQHITYVCNAWEIDKYFNKNSVDEIYCRHSFEHYTFKQGELTLQIWYNILKHDGKLNIIVPNIDYHIKQFTNEENWHKPVSEKYCNNTNLEHALASLWGWQLSGDTDIHKSGYNFTLLYNILKKYNFKNITRNDDVNPWHLDILCNK